MIDLARLVERKVNAALIIAGEVVATEARRSVQNSPRGGRTYQLSDPKRTHTASAAGEAPATDLGFWCDQSRPKPTLLTPACLCYALTQSRRMPRNLNMVTFRAICSRIRFCALPCEPSKSRLKPLCSRPCVQQSGSMADNEFVY